MRADSAEVEQRSKAYELALAIGGRQLVYRCNNRLVVQPVPQHICLRFFLLGRAVLQPSLTSSRAGSRLSGVFFSIWGEVSRTLL